MSIAPDDFIHTAQKLATSVDEWDLRSAISRAYYAAYHSTLSTLPEKPCVSGGASHEAVIQATKGYVNSKIPKPGRSDAIVVLDALARLKKKRKLADYDLNEAVSQAYTLKAVAEARGVITACCSWSKKLASTAATA